MKLKSKCLSAFIDGELSARDVAEIENALAADPQLRSELRSLVNASAAAQSEFAAMLDAPVSAELARSIWQMPIAEGKNQTS